MTTKEPAATPSLREALEIYANPNNWLPDAQGIRRIWSEPDSTTPDAYNGFEAATVALNDFDAAPAPVPGPILSDERIADLWKKWVGTARPNLSFARAIEAELRFAAPVVPVDRNAVLEEVARWFEDHETILATEEECARVVRDMKSAAPVPLPAAQGAVSEAIQALIEVAHAAHDLLDNTEESGPVGSSVFTHQGRDNADLNTAFDRLEALPDDRPGYSMGPAAKAEWALRSILASQQPADQPAEKKPLVRCAASRDGDCTHPECPQLRDNEPHATGRHCPIDTSDEDEQ